MNRYTAIELEKLPAPHVVEPLDYATLKEAAIADLRSRHPEYDGIVEGDPAVMLLESAAYMGMLLRARVNSAALATMLATAQGSDLDHLAAQNGVQRLLIKPADDTVYPRILAVYESDEQLRLRAQLALESFTTAGSQGSYEFWARSASGQVKDVDIYSPPPETKVTSEGTEIIQPSGHVIVTVLAHAGNGIPDDVLLKEVEDALNAEEVRPITDLVTVQPATILNYRIIAKLFFYRGPDPDVVRQESIRKVVEYVKNNHLLGHDITISGIYAALHQTGVQRVELSEPSQTLQVSHFEAAFCTEIDVSFGGYDL